MASAKVNKKSMILKWKLESMYFFPLMLHITSSSGSFTNPESTTFEEVLGLYPILGSLNVSNDICCCEKS